MRKKSQVNAAVLVAIISGLIILYVVFLPEGEREAILEDNLTEEDDGGAETVSEGVLLLEHPGRLAYLKEKELEHIIPPMNLYTSTEATILKSISSVYIKNGVFDKQAKSIAFSVSDLANTKNVILSFDIKKSEGRLVVKLNGDEIFNGEVTESNMEPLNLPSENLKSENLVEISVSEVGFMFWKTNEYTLENLKILADVTDVSARKGTGAFFVEDAEAQNLQSAKLKFFPDCEVRKVSKLDVLINNYNVISSIPDCGMLQTVEFSPFILIEGENKLEFKTDKGQYLIDRIVVKTELKEAPSYVQYFELSENQMQRIGNKKMDVNLTLIFVDKETEKEADIIINGKKTYMPSTKEISFSKKINDYVDEGTNSLKIIPKKTIDVKDLKVELIEK